MASTRKDPRGYVLRTGECYRKSDGRYSYGYTDRCGKRHTIYAKSLVDLRNREKDLQKNLLDGVDPFAAEKWTLNDMDIYAEATEEKKQEVFSNLQGKIF